MSKILFLDIDGVLIPGRAYMLPGQTHDPFVTLFDPCAVAMINEACRHQGRKIVIHSSWIRTKFAEFFVNESVEGHLIRQGIDKNLIHEDSRCNGDIDWRYNRVDEWLTRHPEVSDFFIIDDTECDDNYKFKKHLILTDFDDGISMKNYRQLLDGNRPRRSPQESRN